MPTITEQARATPDKPAFIMGASGEVVTFAELDAKANQIAQLLRASGIQTGQHIAMMLKNCREFIEVVFGCSRAGVVFTPISTHLKKEETAYIINNCNARLFIASASLADVATEAAEHAPELLRKFIVGGETAGFEDWQSAVASQPSDEISDQSLGVPMLYSSGTTGKPKGHFSSAAEYGSRCATPTQTGGRLLRLQRYHRLFVTGAALPFGTALLQHVKHDGWRHIDNHGSL